MASSKLIVAALLAGAQGMPVLGAWGPDPIGPDSAGSLTEGPRVNVYYDPPYQRLRIWAGGALAALDDRNLVVPVVNVFGKDGRLQKSVPISIRGAAAIYVYAISHGLNGSVAATGSVYAEDSRSATWLALTSPNGKEQRIVRTDPFIPAQITLGPDGACWALGYEKAEGRITREHMMLRRYDASGIETGMWLPRSWFPERRYGHPATLSFLAAGRDRIGWYSHVTGEYVEWSFQGQILTRVQGPELRNNDEVNGLGLCPGGEVYLSVSRILKRPVAWEILRLNRRTSAWELVPRIGTAARVLGGLYGCDADGLVAETTGQPPNVLQWFVFADPSR